MGLFELLFGFDLLVMAQEQAWRQQLAQEQSAQYAQTLARQKAEYEAQCELFRRNQEAHGNIIDVECRVIEDAKSLPPPGDAND